MKALALTTGFFFLSIQLITAQLRSTVWTKSLGGTAKDAANDVLINNDGTVVVAGYSHSNDGQVTGHHGDATTADGWVVKLDAAGNLLWQKSVGGTANDYLNTVIATDDGGYLCTGYTYSNDGDVSGNHGMADVWAIKLDDNGTLVWNKCYGGAQMDTAVDAVRLYDGHFALVGSTNSLDGDVQSGPANNTAYDAWVIKLDKLSGNLVWEKVISRTNATTNNVGINIAEVNNTIIAYCGGRLYSVDENTGTAISLKTAGSGDDLVMHKNNNGLHFMHDKLYPRGSPGNCTDRERNFLTLDFNLDTVRSSKLAITGCTFYPDYNWTYYNFVIPGHGMIGRSNGKYLYVGNDVGSVSTYNPRAFISSFGEVGLSSSRDVLRSVKEFAGGEEFIVAGYTTTGKIEDTSASNGGYHGGGDCWIIKFQSLNIIQGNFYIDYNNNNVKDAGEPPFKRALAKTTKQNTAGSWWAYPVNGISQSAVDIGTFKTSASISRAYYTVSPDTTTTIFTTYKNTVSINYPVHPVPGSRDYGVFLTSFSPLRPGFETHNGITYTNFGVDTLQNKNIRLVLNNHLQFSSSIPAPTSVVADTIIWNIAQLQPDSTGFINLYLRADSIPEINLDDTLRLTAYIDDTGDVKPSDNVSSILQGVRGSYDPNDKQENFGGAMYVSEAAVGKQLTYTIRFQNTGNDTAFNITVRDTLNTQLDSASFEMIQASHPYQVSIKDGKYITWQFNGIKLPDSTSNEPLSHGFICYNIKPVLPVGIGDVITNTAAIYFDYNPPIITNTITTTIKGTPVNAVWTGVVSTAWENPLNWSNSQVPDLNTIVTIPAGVPNYPDVSSNASCYRISIMPSATVLVKTGFRLKVNAKN